MAYWEYIYTKERSYLKFKCDRRFCAISDNPTCTSTRPRLLIDFWTFPLVSVFFLLNLVLLPLLLCPCHRSEHRPDLFIPRLFFLHDKPLVLLAIFLYDKL